MEKINIENIVKSFFLGIFIGLVIQVTLSDAISIHARLIMVLASGGIGFLIGFITEWLTSLLPINIANPKNYFFINNVIALAVTTLIVTTTMILSGNETDAFMPILFLILGIVCIANIMEYMMYRRAQNKLRKFKKTLKD